MWGFVFYFINTKLKLLKFCLQTMYFTKFNNQLTRFILIQLALYGMNVDMMYIKYFIIQQI